MPLTDDKLPMIEIHKAPCHHDSLVFRICISDSFHILRISRKGKDVVANVVDVSSLPYLGKKIRNCCHWSR